MGYQALRHGAAWLDLSARGRIVVRGRDRARLLHAIASNEVKKMTPGTGCYAFRLTPQGRVNKKLMRVVLEGGEAPAAGTKTTVDGADAEVTSAVVSPDSGEVVALAYVRQR